MVIILFRIVTQILQEKINRDLIDRYIDVGSMIKKDRDVQEAYHSIYGSDIFKYIDIYQNLFGHKFSDSVIEGLREFNSVVNVLKHSIGKSLYTLQKNYPKTLRDQYQTIDHSRPNHQPIFDDMINFEYASFERYRNIIFDFIDEIPERTAMVSFNDLIVYLDKISIDKC
jgi:hypothetical protein